MQIQESDLARGAAQAVANTTVSLALELSAMQLALNELRDQVAQLTQKNADLESELEARNVQS